MVWGCLDLTLAYIYIPNGASYLARQGGGGRGHNFGARGGVGVGGWGGGRPRQTQVGGLIERGLCVARAGG